MILNEINIWVIYLFHKYIGIWVNQINYFFPIILLRRNYIHWNILKRCKSDELYPPNHIFWEENITIFINQRNIHKSDTFFPPKYIVLGGIICNKRKLRKRGTMDELFCPICIALGGIIFIEINLRKRCKSDELYHPNYIVFGRNYMQ